MTNEAHKFVIRVDRGRFFVKVTVFENDIKVKQFRDFLYSEWINIEVAKDWCDERIANIPKTSVYEYVPNSCGSDLRKIS